MATCRLDRQVLATSMGAVGYHLDTRQGQQLSRLFNETVAAAAKKAGRAVYPGRDSPHAVGHRRGRGVGSRRQISRDPNGRNRDQYQWPQSRRRAIPSVFRKSRGVKRTCSTAPTPGMCRGCGENGPILSLKSHRKSHGHRDCSRFIDLWRSLRKYRSLNICLVHGGGALPFIIGRVSQGYSTMEVCRTIPMFAAGVFSPILFRYARS